MTTETLTRENNDEMLTDKHRIAQAAIHLKDVQEAAKVLAKYNLGVFMPHMHHEKTGHFMDLPKGVSSVEDDLEMSFKTDEELLATGKEWIEVGWQWTDDGITASMSCQQKCIKQGSQHTNDNHNG